jgi:phage terminase small subunit
LPLVTQYVQAIAMSNDAVEQMRKHGAVVGGKVSPFVIIQEKAVRASVALSMRLRLSPQARQPNNPKRPPRLSAYELMREGLLDE